MDQRVQVVITLMADDLRRVPLLSELAAVVNLSDSRLHHVFKAEPGMTTAQYLKSAQNGKDM